MPGFFWRLRDFLKAENRQPNNIIAGQDGKLYEIRDSLIGRLVLHRPLVPSLDVIKEGFDFRLPKIPGELLTTTISFFNAYCNSAEQNEVMVQVFYDLQTGQYELDCPVQSVRWDSIEADCTQRFNEPRYVQVLHIHSHNAMPAFFSTKDNFDEKAFMLYAVIGGLMNEAPEMKLRVGARGQFFSLPIDYIFDKPDVTHVGTYPDEWHQRVHKSASGYEYDIETMIPLMYKFWVAEASEQEIFEDARINHDFPKVHAANMVEKIKATDLDSFIRDCGAAWDAYLQEVLE
ncbi:hypothetical protein M5X11_12445 [Paenibacillus alginolyticus]|uniref:hypothetical protein n=1 Tax=Paenibacillus alginolyticus TaxID=59839 RepID=UPI000410C7A3|nr:hypothetical protein [Paenibacillus alginolyticus]MCY9665765.1 hypothetical protein [Paenibacillus alginolyticus]